MKLQEKIEEFLREYDSTIEPADIKEVAEVNNRIVTKDSDYQNGFLDGCQYALTDVLEFLESMGINPEMDIEEIEID